MRFVHVDGAGGILATSGGIAVAHGGTGFYFVTFPASVWSKSIASHLTRVTALTFNGQITATPCGGAPQGVACSANNNQQTVLIDTTDASGTLTDRSFFVSVFG